MERIEESRLEMVSNIGRGSFGTVDKMQWNRQSRMLIPHLPKIFNQHFKQQQPKTIIVAVKWCRMTNNAEIIREYENQV